MSVVTDALTTFAFGAYEAQQTLFKYFWILIFPSLGAMVLTAAGHLRTRDLVVMFSIPGIAAAVFGAFAYVRQDAGLYHGLLGLGSPSINTAMLVIATLLLPYSAIWTISGSTAFPVLRKIIAYGFVWALCATNLMLLYKSYAGPVLNALQYNSPGLALGWIAGNQASLLAACLIPPSLAGVLRSQVPNGFRQTTVWLAMCIYAAVLMLIIAAFGYV
jgi:hypothetical protein